MGYDDERSGRKYGRVYNRDTDMGGSHWSGASGRGGMMYRRDRWDDGYRPDYERGTPFEVERDFSGRSFPGNDFSVGRDEVRFYDRGEQRHPRGYDPGPYWGKGPKGYRRSDERIREDVCEAIADQGHIDASDVEVVVEDGVVILSGTVGLRHQKRALEMLVETCRGVDEVRNELRLKRPSRERLERREPQEEAPYSNGHRVRGPRSSA